MMNYYIVFRLWLCAAVLSFSPGFAPQNAHAQQGAIESCAREVMPEARIKCLENALRAGVDSQLGEIADDDAKSITTESPEPITDSNIQPLPQEQSAATEAKASTVQRAPEPAGLGSEQVITRRRARAEESRHQEAERTVFEVASLETIYPGKLRVFLKNGHVWQQIQSDTQRLSLDEGDLDVVEIWRSRFGGYKLRMSDLKRTVRVRRLR